MCFECKRIWWIDSLEIQPKLEEASNGVDGDERGVADEEAVLQPDGTVQGADHEREAGDIAGRAFANNAETNLNPVKKIFF